jgi:hypothetical protein
VGLADACERDMLDYHALYDRTNWSDPQEWQGRHAVEKYEILVPSGIESRFIKNMPNG